MCIQIPTLMIDISGQEFAPLSQSSLAIHSIQVPHSTLRFILDSNFALHLVKHSLTHAQIVYQKKHSITTHLSKSRNQTFLALPATK